MPTQEQKKKKKNRQKAKSGHKAEIDKKHFRQEAFTLERVGANAPIMGG